jgi:membrane-bound lytic murein transglycosylase D
MVLDILRLTKESLVTYSRLPIIGFFSSILLISTFAANAQQLDGQSNSGSLNNSDDDGSVVADINTESYLETVSKLETRVDHPFQPTASDLLIQQAEEKLHRGRESYRQKDSERARHEFDDAIELMLRASDNPSDRLLYESRMEEMVDSIHRLDMAGLGAAVPPSNSPQFEKAPLEELLQMTFPLDPKIKNKVQGELSATTSELPLTMNDAVLSYINYFSGKGHRTMVAGLERAGKYRPMIERVLSEEGVPLELIHLAQAESGFLPRALSNKAAAGMWQFVKFRGQQYGLNQTLLTDDRLDPEKATRAAARHLKDLYHEFGNWYLAIAAYNCGPGNVEKAVERTGYADFFELRARRAIPAETTNYVPIILAMTIMTKNAKEYGLDEVVPQTPLEYDTVDMNAATNLELIGDLTDTPVSQLMELNPALLKSIAPDGYSVRVPKGSGSTLSAAIQTVPATQRASWRMHLVTEGDTLAAIARRYGSTPKSIADANQLGNGMPNNGDRLLIPAAYHTPASRPVTQTFASRQKKSATQRTVVVTASTAKRIPVHTTVRTATKLAPAAALKPVAKHRTTGAVMAQVRSAN